MHGEKVERRESKKYRARSSQIKRKEVTINDFRGELFLLSWD